MMVTSSIERYWNLFAELMMTPAGIVILFICICFGVIAIVSERAFWSIYVFWLVTGMMGENGENVIQAPFILPLEKFRAASKVLFAGLLLLLAVKWLVALTTRKGHPTSWAAKLLFLLQIYYAIRAGLEESPLRACVAGISCILLFIVTYKLSGMYVTSLKDIRQWLMTILMCGIVFLGLCAVQIPFGIAPLIMGNRFSGLTSNPQVAAINLAFCCIISLYFVVSRQSSKITWYLSLISFLFLSIFLLWTGSRTGLLMALAGIAVLVSSDIRAIGLSGIFVLAICGLLSLFDISPIGFERLVNGGDTRTEAWRLLLQRFMDNPIFGSPEGRLTVESFPVVVLAYSGLIGALILMSCISCLAVGLNDLRIRSAGNKEYTLLTRLFIGLSIALCLGSLFEAFLFGISTTMVVLSQLVIGLSYEARYVISSDKLGLQVIPQTVRD